MKKKFDTVEIEIVKEIEVVTDISNVDPGDDLPEEETF